MMQTVEFLKFYTAHAEDNFQAKPEGKDRTVASDKRQAVGLYATVSRIAKFIAPADALSALKD